VFLNHGDGKPVLLGKARTKIKMQLKIGHMGSYLPIPADLRSVLSTIPLPSARRPQTHAQVEVVRGGVAAAE